MDVAKPKPQPLDERTLNFARRVRLFVNRLPRTLGIIEDAKQLIRSSGSVGANYREANEALSKKDCAMRMKICRKEARESAYWLELLDQNLLPDLDKERQVLLREAKELKFIFHAIIQKYYS